MTNQILIQNHDSQQLEAENEKLLPENQAEKKESKKEEAKEKVISGNESIDEEIKREIQRTNYNGKALPIWHTFDLEKKKLFLKKLKELQ